MRFVTYDAGSGPRAGVLRDGAVVDAGPGGVGALLRASGLDGIGHGGPTVDPAGVRLLPPVIDPGKIVCMGLNYRDHAAEAGLDPPETPTFFAKFANCLAPPDAEVPLPAFSQKVDYEAEVAFAIGERCKDVAARDALGKVAGYMLLNDLSARDYQFMTPQWLPGKVFDGSAPCGPALVTPDEAGPHDGIEMSLTLNGQTMQQGSTADLIHGIPALVEYLSKLMTLEPGDVVSTGTPAGVGSARDPHVWLKPGDVTVIESPTLGRLETRLT
ncbi:MAG TPA: fumarylacetoacetate hydrolase family protein [Thermoleophilaceae bacterium]|jgi:2-keto-4-pentenoate hydratase/2-oxohepta-3-ene-1,7-dioic acid hydratase in catechol pathway